MSLNDQTMAGEMAKWDAYFERMKIGKVYDNHSDALKDFEHLNSKMNDDFCLPIALIHCCQTNQFKITEKEEDGWQVLVCNALFAFGKNPRVKIVDPNGNEV